MRLWSQCFRCLRAAGASLEKNSPARPWSLAQITSACPCSVISVPGSTQRNARFEFIGTGSVACIARPVFADIDTDAGKCSASEFQVDQSLHFVSRGFPPVRFLRFLACLEARLSPALHPEAGTECGSRPTETPDPFQAMRGWRPRAAPAFVRAATGPPCGPPLGPPADQSPQSASNSAAHDQLQRVLPRRALHQLDAKLFESGSQGFKGPFVVTQTAADWRMSYKVRA